MKTLTEKQLIYIARNPNLYHDSNGKCILSKQHKKEYDIFMFGEEFMESTNKGEKVIYSK